LGDLTTLAAVKRYLRVDQAEDQSKHDVELGRLISAVSAQVRSETGIAFDVPLLARTEGRDGDGGTVLLLDEYPVVSITSLTVDGVAIPVRPSVTGYGYVLTSAAIGRIELVGYTFTKGTQNVSIVYRAGATVSDEAGTIPGTPYQLQAAQFFAGDLGVKFAAGGAALTLVTGTPSANQYTVSSSGLYTFAAADTTKGVLISYGTIPADIQQAAIELVALAFTDESRIGRSYQVVAGEVLDFRGGAQLAHARAILDGYRRPGVG